MCYSVSVTVHVAVLVVVFLFAVADFDLYVPTAGDLPYKTAGVVC